MNHHLHRLLNKKPSLSKNRELKCKKLVKSSNISSNAINNSFLKARSSFKSSKKRILKSRSISKHYQKLSSIRKDSSKLSSGKLQNEFAFAIPRRPSEKNEFSFENQKEKGLNSPREIMIPDNFSFSEGCQKGLKRVKREESMGGPMNSQSAKPGVFNSICNTIMTRYNSFIQVTRLSINTLKKPAYLYSSINHFREDLVSFSESTHNMTINLLTSCSEMCYIANMHCSIRSWSSCLNPPSINYLEIYL